MTKRDVMNLAERLFDRKPPPGELRDLWSAIVKDVAESAVPMKYVATFFDRAGYVGSIRQK